MKLIWTFGSMPELEHLSPTEKARVLGRGKKRGTLVWLWAQAVGVGGFVGSAIATLALVLITQNVSGPQGLQFLFWIVGIPLAIIAWFQVNMRLIRRQVRRAIIESTKGDRLPVCLSCGYDPRGGSLDRCPECNAPLRIEENTAKAG